MAGVQSSQASLEFYSDSVRATIDITALLVPLDTPLLRDDYYPFAAVIARALLAGCTTWGEIVAAPTKAAIAPGAAFSATLSPEMAATALAAVALPDEEKEPE